MSNPHHISGVLPEAMRRIQDKSPFRAKKAKYVFRASCGHLILTGDTIGYDPATKQTRCHQCFANIREREARARQTAVNERMKVE